jgi:hypothetical protein
MLKLATVAALMAAAALAAPASANTLLGVTSVTVKNALSTYLQVAEFQAFQYGTGTNVALAGTATAHSVWDNGSAVAGLAIDGTTIAGYPNLYHSAGPGADEFLTITFAAPVALSGLKIFGRTDCCSSRDSYTVTAFHGATSIYTGSLDARTGSGTISFIPEPAIWGLMLAGFGAVGVSMRRKSTTVAA